MGSPHWYDWWVWAAAGLVLAILEVVLPGYIFLGFAAGAWGMALLLLVGLSGLSVPMMLVIFAVMSLIAFLALRRIFPHSSGEVKVWHEDINDND